jgi:alpha-galactosidase
MRVGGRLRHLGTALALVVASAAPLAAKSADPLAPAGSWTANVRGEARVPPMGWNSWNAFLHDIDEEKVMASARIIAGSGLAAKGYRYINLDDGWWLKRRQPDGRMVIRADRFPSARTGTDGQTSFRPLTDRLHAMGFKAGIYSDIGRNSCGQVFTPNFVNQPEGTIAEREVGLYGHVDQDIALYFKEWGFDFIKVDACGIRGLGPDSEHVRKGDYRLFPPLVDMNDLGRTDVDAVRRLYAEVRDALARYNPDNDHVYSICLWGSANVRAWGKDLGNISRTSDDITPHWTRMLTNFDTVATRALYAKPGAWNDADMLFVGSGDFDASHMMEARSHFALWAMMNSPLLIGFDLRKATPDQLELFGNQAIIALNQDPAGHQAVPVYRSDDLEIFAKTLSNGSKGVAIFNRGLAPIEAILTADQLKFRDDSDVALTDLWTGKVQRFRGEVKLQVEPRQTLMFTASGARSLADGYYLSEVPGNVNPAVDGVTIPQHDPAIHRSVVVWTGTRGSGEFPQYGGFGGAQADRSPFGEPLRVAGQRYDTGIGVLANSRLEVRNDAQTRFSAEVGIDDSAVARDRSITFAVYGDGHLLVRSRPLRFGERPEKLETDVRGVKLIELIARADTPAAMSLPVVWANAALTGGGAR